MNTVSFTGQPIAPSKIVCVGRNYAAHIAELGNETPEEPVIFVKPNSAIGARPLASTADEIHYEGEIALLIQGGAIAGVGFGLDLTKRAVQLRLKTKGLPWERAKGFDGAAVFSDFVPFVGDLDSLRLELWIDGARVQAGGVARMLFKPQALLAEVATFMTLADGDLLMTGTPEGVGAIHTGQQMVGKVFAGARLLVEVGWTVG
ncbi:MAG: 2-keto-4-pentenoate hydratase [Alphaproteobacteria bacterium CG_4_10_14_0_2_um_filter_63_37]|nr:MAG: 2-keto-4-pentenoate hydratase [Proteobacteria bacterium CG1_02_64_396]PJA25802.1 MAG: 2-keto-4-pentenoate hydratase [Alphaproteobacteria bacterium CG_4_10_14_0_2_um_filter_63_37]